MADLNRELEELAELTHRVNEELRIYGQITAESAAALKDAEMKEKYGIENYTKVTENAAVAVKALGRSVTEGVASMYNNKKGMSAFNSSLDQISTAAMAAGTALMLLGGPIGMVAGAAAMAAAGLMKLFGVANEQSDAVFKGFQEISKSGAAASDGMSGLFAGVQKLGIGFQSLDTYVRVLADSSREFALFRGNVFEGRKAFEDINMAMRPYTESLYAMGFTQEEVVEASASYLRLQSRIGLTQNKTVAELAESTRKYLIEQDALTKLTGMTRKEQEDAREEIRSQERFAAVLAEMRAKGQNKAASELEASILMVGSKNKILGQGLADLSTGLVTTEAAQKALLTTQGQALIQAQRLRAGQADAISATSAIAKAAGNNAKAFNQLAQAGVYESVFGSFSGDIQLGLMEQHDLVKQRNIIERDALEAGILGGKAADDATRNQIRERIRQRDLMLQTQKSMDLLGGPASTAVTTFTSAIEMATDAIEWMVSKIPGFTPRTREEMQASRAVAEAKDQVRALETQVANARSEQDRKVFEKQLKAAEKQLLNAEVQEKYAKDRAASQGAGPGGQQLRADGSIISPGDADYVKPTPAPRASLRTGVAPTNTMPRPTSPAELPAPKSGSAEGEKRAPTTAERMQGQSKGSLQIGPNADTSGLKPELLDRLTAFAEASGRQVTMTSGYRSDQKQAELWVRGRILNEPGIYDPAAPKDDQEIVYKGKRYFVKGSGRGSLHLVGDAADISVAGMGSSRGSIDELMRQYELYRPFLPKDPPHVQMLAEGGIVEATPGGVPAIIGEGGSDEAVIPLKNGSVPVSFDSNLLIKRMSDNLAREMAKSGPIADLAQTLSNIKAPANIVVDDQMRSQLSELAEDVRDQMQDAIRQMSSEFKSALDQIMRNMPRGDNPYAAEQLTLLNALVSEQKTANDISKKILYSQS